MQAVTWIFTALVVGGTAFYGLSALACRALLRRRDPPAPTPFTPISVLKPLAGLDLGLEENLRGFFLLNYPDYDLLLAVRGDDDPAAEVARRLIEQYPTVRARLVVAGEPPSLAGYPNAKNWSLLRMAEQASGEILVISDSDIRSRPDDLRALAVDFADPRVGVVTCPYRAVPGGGPWSFLEAIGMNTEFWAGAVSAQFLGPMDFAVGPTMALRRECLDEIGGFELTRDVQAEDFALGQAARRAGWEVRLSKRVVEHHIGSQGFRDNWAHRLRWHRSTRRSRPVGYMVQAFTYPLPFAAALVLLTSGAGWAWGLLGICGLARLVSALSTSHLLGDRLLRRKLYLLPVQDLLSFVAWLRAFQGGTVVWRGRVFDLSADGRMRLRPGYNVADSTGGNRTA